MRTPRFLFVAGLVGFGVVSGAPHALATLDSGSIAFARQRPDGTSAVMVTDPAGILQPTRITTRKEVAGNPAYRPDGERIAFASDRTGDFDIWTADIDGSNRRNVTQDLVDDFSPTWSPDGEQIAYVSADSIFVIDADGTGRHRLTRPRSEGDRDDTPSWSSRNVILFQRSLSSGGIDLWSIRPDGSHLRRRTYSPEPDAFGQWSHDGRWIAFTRLLSGGFPGGNAAIMVMRRDGSNLQAITSSPHIEAFPVWSPSDDLIAFASNRHDSFDVYVKPVSGGRARRITSTAADDVPGSWRTPFDSD